MQLDRSAPKKDRALDDGTFTSEHRDRRREIFPRRQNINLSWSALSQAEKGAPADALLCALLHLSASNVANGRKTLTLHVLSLQTSAGKSAEH